MPVPVIGAYGIGILLVLLLAFFMAVPLKIVFRLIYNGLMGGLALWLINLVGAPFGFILPISCLDGPVGWFFRAGRRCGPGCISVVLFWQSDLILH